MCSIFIYLILILKKYPKITIYCNAHPMKMLHFTIEKNNPKEFMLQVHLGMAMILLFILITQMSIAIYLKL